MEKLKFSVQHAGADVRGEVARRLKGQPVPAEIYHAANHDLAQAAARLSFTSGRGYEDAVRHLVATDLWLGLGALPWLDGDDARRVLADVGMEVVP